MPYNANEIMAMEGMSKMRPNWFLFAIMLCAALLNWNTCCATPLTLRQAEHEALLQSPEIKSMRAKSRALGQSAIAANQLSDPKLILGTINVPVDTFDFAQEPMTQIQIGLEQNFPRGRSLHYRSQQKKELSTAEMHKQAMTRLQVLQGVRLSWINLYYWLTARKIVIKQKRVFQHLLEVAESMLANNKAQQMDVVRAQLELTELDNQLLDIHQHIETARATLARWIGPKLANLANPTQLPIWSFPPNMNKLNAEIKQHPVLKTDEAKVAAGDAGVKLAKQQYWPGFTVGVAYGFREGQNVDGHKRPDFLTAQVKMDLPIFTSNRQDRTLNASEDRLIASQEDQFSDYRQLHEALNAQYVAWQQDRKSAQLYQAKLIPEAKQYASATMTAYQNTQTDFPTLARAYIRELNTSLMGLRALVNREVARVNLLYLQGQ